MEKSQSELSESEMKCSDSRYVLFLNLGELACRPTIHYRFQETVTFHKVDLHFVEDRSRRGSFQRGFWGCWIGPKL